MKRPDLTYPYFNSKDNLNSHYYLLYCCDVLTSILQYADNKNLGNISIKFSNDDWEKFSKLNDNDDRADWLVSNGYKNQVYEKDYRHILFSAIKDFHNFMFESIICAGKMKLSVAYALLRRPFKDTLGIIEWLAVDRDTVIYNLSETDNPTKLKVNFHKAQDLTNGVKEKYGFEPHFDLRYKNKNTNLSFELIWNKALHIVTAKTSPSGKGELNFVFTDKDKLAEFSDWYYKVVPLVMNYALELIVTLFEAIAMPNEITVTVNKFNRLIHCNSVMPTITDLLRSNTIPFFCPQCETPYDAEYDEFASQLLCGTLYCNNCNTEIDTRLYITEYENIVI